MAPLKPIPRHKEKTQWMNPHIKALMRHRDFVAKKVCQTGRGVEDLKLIKKIVKSNVRRVIKTHGSKMLTDGDMRSAWKFLREITFTMTKGTKTTMDLTTLNEALQTL